MLVWGAAPGFSPSVRLLHADLLSNVPQTIARETVTQPTEPGTQGLEGSYLRLPSRKSIEKSSKQQRLRSLCSNQRLLLRSLSQIRTPSSWAAGLLRPVQDLGLQSHVPRLVDACNAAVRVSG